MEIKENTAYHCKTEALAKEFLQECDEQGIKWDSGDRAASITNYNRYKDDTCYVYCAVGNKPPKLYYVGILAWTIFSDIEVELVEYEGSKKV